MTEEYNMRAGAYPYALIRISKMNAAHDDTVEFLIAAEKESSRTIIHLSMKEIAELNKILLKILYNPNQHIDKKTPLPG